MKACFKLAQRVCFIKKTAKDCDYLLMEIKIVFMSEPDLVYATTNVAVEWICDFNSSLLA